MYTPVSCLIYIPASSLQAVGFIDPVGIRIRFHVSVRARFTSADAFWFLLWWLSSTAGYVPV
jgi:hypothetical protein